MVLGVNGNRQNRAPEPEPEKKVEIKQYELEQITPRKVSIPDAEIPQSKHRNWSKRPILVDPESGLKYKRLEGKRIYIEKWIK